MHPEAFLALTHDVHGRFASHFYVVTVGFKELSRSNERALAFFFILTETSVYQRVVQQDPRSWLLTGNTRTPLPS